jgi:hypothetical protein
VVSPRKPVIAEDHGWSIPQPYLPELLTLPGRPALAAHNPSFKRALTFPMALIF